MQAFSGDDHVFLSAANQEAARLVERADVACVEPSVLECGAFPPTPSNIRR